MKKGHSNSGTMMRLYGADATASQPVMAMCRSIFTYRWAETARIRGRESPGFESSTRIVKASKSIDPNIAVLARGVGVVFQKRLKHCQWSLHAHQMDGWKRGTLCGLRVVIVLTNVPSISSLEAQP